GPRDPYHRTFEYLKRMDDGRAAVLLNDTRAGWRWSRGYVENVAAAIARAATDHRAAGRTYNLAEPQALPEAHWVRHIGRAAGWGGGGARPSPYPKSTCPPIYERPTIGGTTAWAIPGGSGESWAIWKRYPRRKGCGTPSPGSGRTRPAKETSGSSIMPPRTPP